MGWLTVRTTGKDTRHLQGGTTFNSLNGALILSIGLPQGIDNMAKESRTNGNIDDLAGTFHGVALLDETAITKDGDAGVDAGCESCIVAVNDAAKKSE